MIELIRCIYSFWIIFMLFNLQTTENSSLSNLLQLKDVYETKKLLRIIYFREFDRNIDENSLTNDISNLTQMHGIDLKLHVLDQSKSLLTFKLCSLISDEQRDTIIIADLYTKEIDLISRSLKIPTITITNHYQLVNGKTNNPYVFKLMSDAIEESQFVAEVLDTRSVYTRIALIYDTSPDMIEYRLSYLRLAKQHIVYQAHLPRTPLSYDFNDKSREIINDLIKHEFDLILCVMSSERQLQFIRFIKDFGTSFETDLLLNKTSWWFTSRLGDIQNLTYIPKVYTASEDRRRLLAHFSNTSIRILLNAIIRTYLRLNISTMSIGTKTCIGKQNAYQLTKTHMFIKLFSNFTEWYCDIRVGSGTEPILFDSENLAWRVPTMFLVHTEHSCQGMLTRTFFLKGASADQLFRSCRTTSSSMRKTAQSTQLDNSSSVTLPSQNALVDIKNYHQMFARLSTEGENHCQYVHIHLPLDKPVIVGVVEPPYIFVSDNQITSEFDCNYGIPCYQIDPLSINFNTDALFFHSTMSNASHCCYGISISLLLHIEDSKLIPTLKATKLFVFSDKPNKWLALVNALKNRRAHFSISGMPHESFLAHSIDLSPPFYHSSYVILTVPQPTGPSLSAFLQPFSWTTWLLIFLLLNMTALFEVFFEWHSPYGLTPKGRRRNKVFSLASALTLSWSIIFSHTFKTKSPKCWSNRFLGNVWGGFGIVFIAIYTAKLAAFMVEMSRAHTVNDVPAIIDVCRRMPRCTIGVVPNTSDEEYLKRFHLNTLYRHMQDVSSYAQGIDLLRSHAITYLLMDHSMARYYLTRDVFKLIRISDDDFGRFGLSLGFSKFETGLKDNVTNILLSYVDKGIIQHLHDDWYVYENCDTKPLDENYALSVDRFFGVFILLIAGVAAGIVTLVLEWIIFKFAVPYWRRRKWLGWLFCSQRLYAVLNVSDDIFDKVYRSSKNRGFPSVGERLHNYSTRTDSLDLHVVNVPKLLTTTCQLKEQMKTINQQQSIPLLPPNGFVARSTSLTNDEIQTIRKRISELEHELTRLKLQLGRNPTPNNS